MQMDILMGAIKGGKRRRHSDEFKAMVIAACRQPGASVAGVARVHQLNANLVSIWLRHAQGRLPAPTDDDESQLQPVVQEFVPLQVTPQAKPPAGPALKDIRVEWRRGDTTVTVSWPSQAAGDCAAWLQDLLR